MKMQVENVNTFVLNLVMTLAMAIVHGLLLKTQKQKVAINGNY
jgi:hypothetical protein